MHAKSYIWLTEVSLSYVVQLTCYERRHSLHSNEQRNIVEDSKQSRAETSEITGEKLPLQEENYRTVAQSKPSVHQDYKDQGQEANVVPGVLQLQYYL